MGALAGFSGKVKDSIQALASRGASAANGNMVALPRFEPITAEVDGHRLDVAIGGAERLALLLDLISKAETSLQLFFYIFENGRVARLVLEALIDARRRNVTVCLLIDGFGSAHQGDVVFAELRAAGATFARFNPNWGRRYLLRNHQKMVVADRKRALIGGSNVADKYFADSPDGSSWHDIFLVIEGPAANRLAAYHDQLHHWMIADRARLRELTRLLASASDSSGPLRWLFNGPFNRLSPLTRQIKHDIDSAQQLEMIQAYFAPNWGMLRRLGRIAGARGGVFRLITAARSDNRTTIAAARHCYRRLLRRGTEIHEYLPQSLHMKLIVADDAVYIGSANFDMRSLFINSEIMLRVEDSRFAGKIRALIAAHLPHCDAITRDVHRARSSPLTRLSWLIGYFIVSSVDFTVTRRFNLRQP